MSDVKRVNSAGLLLILVAWDVDWFAVVLRNQRTACSACTGGAQSGSYHLRGEGRWNTEEGRKKHNLTLSPLA